MADLRWLDPDGVNYTRLPYSPDLTHLTLCQGQSLTPEPLRLAPPHVPAPSDLRGFALFDGPRAQFFRLLHHLGVLARGGGGRRSIDHGALGHERVRDRIALPAAECLR